MLDDGSFLFGMLDRHVSRPCVPRLKVGDPFDTRNTITDGDAEKRDRNVSSSERGDGKAYGPKPWIGDRGL